MNKQSIPAMIVVLTIICLASACSLGFLYLVTKEKIEEQEKKATEESLTEVLPEADPQGFERVQAKTKGGGPFEYYMAYDKPLASEEKKLIGYAAIGSAKGYSSTIVVMVGVDPEIRKVKGLRVLHQQETPGLGSQCQTVVTDKKLWKPFDKGGKPTSWADQFAGRFIDDLKVVKEETEKNIQAITGATITSNAVVRAARDAISTLDAVLREGSQ
jgi:electron transport complex protein RnfG